MRHTFFFEHFCECEAQNAREREYAAPDCDTSDSDLLVSVTVLVTVSSLNFILSLLLVYFSQSVVIGILLLSTA